MARVLPALGGLAAGIVVLAPIAGWPPVLRLGAVAGALGIAALVEKRPWRWTDLEWDRVRTWEPSRSAITVGAVGLGVLLFWIVFSKFQSGEINAVDFTVYFDRPSYQTARGNPMLVETADRPELSNRSELAVHAYWLMVPIGYLYRLRATPQWLLALSAASIAFGAFYLFRITRGLAGSGALACAAALAFALNSNTARTLSYGFHAEVLYAWFIPWLIDAAMRGATGSFVLAGVASILVKEDACLPLFAAAVGLMLARRRGSTLLERPLVALPCGLALVALVAYYSWLPFFTPGGRPAYSLSWANYGPTPFAAAWTMMFHPVDVAVRAFTSGFFTRVMAPHLFLPFIGWQWAIGVLPMVMVYGAAADEQLRAFGLYYSIPFVPFLTIASAVGAVRTARLFGFSGGRACFVSSTLVLGGAILVGSSSAGFSLRPWRQQISAVPSALARLSDRPVILVQSGLYTHAGYDPRIKLLTRETLTAAGNEDATVLLAPGINSYPLGPDEMSSLLRLEQAGPMPAGLVAITLAGRGSPRRGPA